ncbi:MAG: 1-(5-phosphoribosyl)-5-[(5-phosphoribosylamino)methylideneamino]imidazole-4-carboxamide isomerase [bacterium]
MLQIIPAIDLKRGRCVRLVQGRMELETLYFEDPVEAAKLWARQGAGRIHLVDLDGAMAGRPQNATAIRRIVEAVSVPVQVGGGIRQRQDIRSYLEIGVDRVILGTLALEDLAATRQITELFPGRILLGIDAESGRVAVRGWKDVTEVRTAELLGLCAGMPLAGVIHTDIRRDGMLSGPNFPALREVLSATSLPVIASGGITTAEDLKGLARLERLGLVGAIVGKALYAGRLTFQAACDSVSDVGSVD